MRTYTLLFSIAAHLAIVGALFVVPIVATNVLPMPRRAMIFTVVTPPLPPPPAKPTIPQQPQSALVAGMAPIMEPTTIEPELPQPGPAAVAPGVDGAPDGVADLGALGFGVVPQVTAPPPPAPPALRTPIRVGSLQAPQRIHYEAPQYPVIARESRVEGLVILEAVIGEDGSVRDVRVLKSIRLLDQAAVDAVRRWRFTPTLLNGQAVPIVMTVTVTFSLN
jgi:protein TonB